MEPLRVVAEIPGAIALLGGPVALDALLAWAVAARDGLPNLEDAYEPIEIPVAREPQGRFHLASCSEHQIEEYDRHWVNRRFPVAEAIVLGGPRLRRVDQSAGPQRSYRIPMEVGYLTQGRMTWWCVGGAPEVRALLALVSHVGKKRATGHGRVVRWLVEPCEPWEGGFPVVRDGRPLRPLPIDWRGLVEPETAYRALTYPYWQNERRELLAVPG